MAASKSFDLNQFLATRTEAVNRALDKFLPPEKTKPATIHKAMRYSLFAGGKRMRPALCLAAAEACGGSDEADACRWPAPSSASTPTRSSTTICRRWTTTISAAASRPTTRSSAKASPCWRATRC